MNFEFGGDIAWRPTPDYIENSRLMAFMRRHGIHSYDELMRRSIADPDWFWPAVLDDLGIEFYRPYSRVLDTSRGIAWARWCVDGRMKRSEYRKFRIRGPAPDDFAAMEEVVLRRYQRLLALGGPFPDLILIDGGKGQLTSAYTALRNLGLERLVAIGLAKEEELIFTRDRAEGIALPRESAALRLIQRIRDEAHRFAITFHRQSRRRRDLRSALDDVAGIGPRRRKQLLTSFGSVAGVRRASRAELEAVVGAKAADAVIRHFSD